MTDKFEVFATHCRHPDWGCTQIAQYLGCQSPYVRATNIRFKLGIPTKQYQRDNKVSHDRAD